MNWHPPEDPKEKEHGSEWPPSSGSQAAAKASEDLSRAHASFGSPCSRQKKSLVNGDAKDRLVSERRRRNDREYQLSDASSHTITGPSFCEHELQQGHELRAYSDDLADVPPSSPAPRDRAVTNAVAPRWTAPDFDS